MNAGWHEGALAGGFADLVPGTQACFRVLIDALARPGLIVIAGTELSPPPPLHPATAAAALTLFDHETPVWLDSAAAQSEVIAFLCFHCGCPIVSDPAKACFAVIADTAGMPALGAFNGGTDSMPEDATTLIIQADELTNADGARLSGPGIATTVSLGASGVAAAFWQERKAQQASFPRGVDIFFTAGIQLAGLPRTTQIEV